MARTKLAVLLATSLADWTKCRLATGLFVLEEATRHVLQREEVCLAMTVAAERTCDERDDNNGKYRNNHDNWRGGEDVLGTLNYGGHLLVIWKVSSNNIDRSYNL